jgi:peptidoglycan/LPS O-acetylase OafA/YrhL
VDGRESSVPVLDVPSAAPQGRAKETQRTDIQALRAFAVSAVLLYHLWPTHLPGGFTGVDVFFVISGFLITSHLIGSAPRRPADFARFWGRRVQRLLPAVALVIVAMLVTTVAAVPRSLWQATAHDAVASMFYVENWRLISTSTTYLGATATPSPFQHFWSLSVEEQYYIVWPFVVAVLALLALRLRRRNPAPLYIAGFAVVVAASLVTSAVVTRNNPAAAYFSTYTRMWELGIGSLLAASYPALSARLRPWPALRVAVLWLGVAGMVTALFAINEHTPFPGTAALVPTLGAALVILADCPEHRLVPRAVIDSRPVQHIGNTSYAIYLWHWPMIILAPYVLNHPLTRVDKIIVIAASIAVATVSTYLVENPVRRSAFLKVRLWRVFAVGAVASLVVVSVSTSLNATISHSQARTRAQLAAKLSGADVCLGAGAADRSHHCPRNAPLVTTPEFAKSDLAESIYHCLNWPPFPTVPLECTRGVSTGATKRIALLGNSHAAQWLPALEVSAQQRKWRIDTYLAALCLPITAPQGPFSTSFHGVPADKLSPMCQAFAATLVDQIVQRHYDVVVLSVMDRSVPLNVAAYADIERRLAASGAHVVVIRDTPAPLDRNNQTPDCVGRNLGNPAACNGSPARWVADDPAADAATSLHSPNVRVIAFNDMLCSKSVCPAVIGGVIVYADIDHITATMARTFAPYVDRKLVAAIS